MDRKPDFDAIRIGDALPQVSLEITQELINEYAVLSGDFNPIHVDLEAAAKSEFKGTIAHGTIPVEPMIQSICRWLGRPWCPEGTEMHLRFRAPSRPGDSIRNVAKIVDKKVEHGRRTVTVEFSCLNQHDHPVINGTWIVIVPDDQGP